MLKLDIPDRLYKLILVVAFGFAIGAGLQAAARHLMLEAPAAGIGARAPVDATYVETLQRSNATLQAEINDLQDQLDL